MYVLPARNIYCMEVNHICINHIILVTSIMAIYSLRKNLNQFKFIVHTAIYNNKFIKLR